ncbi:MAG: 16S rRNA (cytidine(1402)-2'-O)-methyltransferase [Candidatus Gottesmanbacteria bacterium]
MAMLFLVSTPIGNIEDISIRALKTLFSAKIIACEDTRQTGQLLAILKERFPAFVGDITPKLIAYHDKNEEKLVPELISILEAGASIALVSDAGTPLISDPGFRLVATAIKRGIHVIPIPGASAILPALQLSGFPVHRWMFIGYFPEKQTHRMKLLEELKKSSNPCTTISYCAPHKLENTLHDLESVYGSAKRIAVMRELTKVHENVWRGSVSDAHKALLDPKGEIVLIF